MIGKLPIFGTNAEFSVFIRYRVACLTQGFGLSKILRLFSEDGFGVLWRVVENRYDRRGQFFAASCLR